MSISLFKDYVTDVLNGSFSEEDKLMSSQVMSYFTNFANNGYVCLTFKLFSKSFLSILKDTFQNA